MTTKLNKEVVQHNMKLIRGLTGLSMQDFGQKLGISKDQVASYENGKALPQASTIMRICELADITREQLLTSKISKEEIVKEMFVVLNNTNETAGDEKMLSELRKVIDVLQQTINAQSKVIESQQRMLDACALPTRA